jgi:hypothetical protein
MERVCWEQFKHRYEGPDGQLKLGPTISGPTNSGGDRA